MAYGGLPYYEVANNTPPLTVSKWNQVLYSDDYNPDRVFESSDNPKILASCPQLSLGDDGEDWKMF
jgi:hypothetical protein